MTTLALGSIAERLNRPGEPRAVLSGVAEAIRDGTGAKAVSIWVERPMAGTWEAISAPAGAAEPDLVPSLATLPAREGRLRVPVTRDGITLALVETDGGDAGEELVRVAADMIATWLASLRIAAELQARVAGQAREIEDERRFTGLVIDSLPVGLYVVDREYRIRVWNRKRETGTQGLRRSDVVGRTVFEVLTRQPAAQFA